MNEHCYHLSIFVFWSGTVGLCVTSKQSLSSYEKSIWSDFNMLYGNGFFIWDCTIGNLRRVKVVELFWPSVYFWAHYDTISDHSSKINLNNYITYSWQFNDFSVTCSCLVRYILSKRNWENGIPIHILLLKVVRL